MTARFTMRAAVAAACLMTTTAAFAAPQDYVFEAVKPSVPSGAGQDLAVRLVHTPTQKPVEGAVLFRSRLDMSPDSMDEMTSALEPLPSTEAGVYRFKANLSMAGRWALKLMAKVPGEKETVQGSVIFTAE